MGPEIKPEFIPENHVSLIQAKENAASSNMLYIATEKWNKLYNEGKKKKGKISNLDWFTFSIYHQGQCKKEGRKNLLFWTIKISK